MVFLSRVFVLYVIATIWNAERNGEKINVNLAMKFQVIVYKISKKNNQRNSGSRVIKFDSLLTPNSMVSNIKLVLFFDLATKYHFHKALNNYYELKFPHISVSQLFWHSKIHTYYLTFPSNSRAKPVIYCYDRVD